MRMQATPQQLVPGLGESFLIKKLALEVRISGIHTENLAHITYKVWLFRVNVVDSYVRHKFEKQTNTKWLEIFAEVQICLNRPPSDLCLGIQISGETGGMTYVTCELEWDDCLILLQERILAARTRAVSIEIKNLVSVAV